MESDASLSVLYNFASSLSIFAALNRVSCLGGIKMGYMSSCFSLARASPRGTEAAHMKPDAWQLWSRIALYFQNDLGA